MVGDLAPLLNVVHHGIMAEPYRVHVVQSDILLLWYSGVVDKSPVCGTEIFNFETVEIQVKGQDSVSLINGLRCQHDITLLSAQEQHRLGETKLLAVCVHQVPVVL